jgi:hypothetical protein
MCGAVISPAASVIGGRKTAQIYIIKSGQKDVHREVQ